MRTKALISFLICLSLVAPIAFAGKQTKPTNGELSYPKGNGLRMVSTGHSWVMPALKTLEKIAAAAGYKGHHQRRHTGGGAQGSAKSIWDKEQAGRKILLPAIATGKWDVMTWGVYKQDKVAYYTPWIDACLKANPGMIFYIQDAWPYAKLGTLPNGQYNLFMFLQAQNIINFGVADLVAALNKKYPGKIRVIPVGNGVCELLKLFFAKKLPYIKVIDSKNRPTPGIYRDGGHIDEKNSGMGWFEGYIYYATLYKKSPELIKLDAKVPAKVPDKELDTIYRKLAWQVVTSHPLSGVTDKNNNGIGDSLEGQAK